LIYGFQKIFGLNETDNIAVSVIENIIAAFDNGSGLLQIWEQLAVKAFVRIYAAKSRPVHGWIYNLPIYIFRYVSGIIFFGFITIKVIPHFFWFYAVPAPK